MARDPGVAEPGTSAAHNRTIPDIAEYCGTEMGTMDVISLHSFDPAIAQQYVAALNGTEPPQPAWSDWWNDALPSSLGQAKSGDERAANRISLGLAWALAGAQPSYLIPGFGLTAWEARTDSTSDVDSRGLTNIARGALRPLSPRARTS